MAITIELWEDTGAVTGGHGTTRQAVTSIGYKDSNLDETFAWVYYPIQRPASGYNYSYTKYNYLKISGTYPGANRFRMTLYGNVEGSSQPHQNTTNEVSLQYQMTNTYALPVAGDMAGTVWDFGNPIEIYPKLSTVGPEAATSVPQYMTQNTTYYTEYFKTQLRVHPDDWNKYGNIGVFGFKFWFHEFENTDY